MIVKDKALSVVETIIGIGQNLGISVIAEGVETEAQRELLQSKGCTQFQGYLFSSPLQIDAFEALVLANQSASNYPE
jgi:diguanylate cyclase